MRKSLVILIYIGLFITNSNANMEFSDPQRSASAQNGYNFHELISSEFDAFNERALVSWINTGNGVCAPSWAQEYECGDYFSTAHQSSTITPDGITARGFSEEWNPFYHALTENYTQSSSTNFSVNFVVDTPLWIVLTGTLETWGDYGGTESGYYYAEIGLSNQSGEIFSARVDSYDNDYTGGEIQIDESLFLEPGLYSLYGNAASIGNYAPYWPYGYDGQAWGVGGGGYSCFNIELVPEPISLLLLGLGSLLAGKK